MDNLPWDMRKHLCSLYKHTSPKPEIGGTEHELRTWSGDSFRWSNSFDASFFGVILPKFKSRLIKFICLFVFLEMIMKEAVILQHGQ